MSLGGNGGRRIKKASLGTRSGPCSGGKRENAIKGMIFFKEKKLMVICRMKRVYGSVWRGQEVRSGQGDGL